MSMACFPFYIVCRIMDDFSEDKEFPLCETSIKEQSRAIVMERQWQVLEYRLDECDGVLSLRSDVSSLINQKEHNSLPVQPMPLLKQNIERLKERGYVISEDGLWARYKD